MSPSSTLSDADAKMSRLILLDYDSGRITLKEAKGYLYLLRKGGLFLVEIAGQKTYLSSNDIEALKNHGIKDDVNVVLDRFYTFTGTTTENQKEHSISFKSLQKTYYPPVNMTDENGNTFVGTSATRLEQKWLPLLREEMRNPGKKQEKKEEKTERSEVKKEKKEEPKTEKEKILACIDRDLEDGFITEEEAENYREKAENGELMLVEMGGAEQNYYLFVNKAQDLLGDPVSADFGFQVAQITPEAEKVTAAAAEATKNTAVAGAIKQEGQVKPLVASEAIDEQAKEAKKKQEDEKQAKEMRENEKLPLIPSQEKGEILPAPAKSPLPEIQIKGDLTGIPKTLLAKGPKDSEEAMQHSLQSQKQPLPSGENAQNKTLNSQIQQGRAQIAQPSRRDLRTKKPFNLFQRPPGVAQAEDTPQTPNRYRDGQGKIEQDKKKKREEISEEMQKKQKDQRYRTPQAAPAKKSLMKRVIIGAGLATGSLIAGGVGIAGISLMK